MPTPPANNPHDPAEILRERFLAAMRGALGDQLPDDPDPLIAVAKNPKFGDYQSNAAMPLAKALGEKPRDIAARIVEHLHLSDIAEPLGGGAIAGPGFINIRLRADALAGLLDALDSAALGVEPPATPSTVAVDLCGVNLAKQMHVGHLRATVIGDALARVFERLGDKVVRQNHLGDWGLPIAMVVGRLLDLERGGAIDLAGVTLETLEREYRRAQADCDGPRKGLEIARNYSMGPKVIAELAEEIAEADEHLSAAKQTLLSLQSGDADAVRVWKTVSDVTLRECLKVCARLRATVEAEHTAGESTYRDELKEVVDDLVARGVAEESEGALVVRANELGVKEPCLIRKGDGGFLYATTDIAGIRRRVQTFGADRLVYAVDARQSLHFRQVFAASKKAGYTRLPGGGDATLQHAAFGTVLGEDNRPFKTRSGENVKLADLVEEAIERAAKVVKEKNPGLSDEERREVAEAVGVGALKYADLSSDRVKDYVFSFDRMLAFEGDTGPYMQYALVRVRSIFRKAREERDIDETRLIEERPPLALNEPAEKTLALTLLRYPGALRSVADTLEPHRLCGYLYELAGAFSSFFESCPVLRAPDDATRRSRLRLASLTGRVLADGLGALGIPTLERM